MPFRVSYFTIQQTGKLGGWSQNFWNSASDLSVTKANAESLYSKMGLIQGAQPYMPAYRISDITTFRNVTNVLHPGATSVPVSSSNPDADYPSTALSLKMTAALNYVTRQWLRGLPDQIIALSGTYQPSRLPGYTTKINNFFAELKLPSNGWSMHVLDRSVLPKVLTNVVVASGVVTVPNHGFGASGDVVKVRIKGTTGYRPLNAIWRSTIIDSNTIQLNFWTPQPSTVVIGGANPTARLQSYILVPIQNVEVVRATSHRTGRPTDLLGGRRRARRT